MKRKFIRIFTANHSNYTNMWLVIFILFPVSLFAQQNTEASRRDTIKYGTDTEITSLIQALRNENADYLDEELAELVKTSRNQRILIGIFNFFGEREKKGLEERAIRAVDERIDEANETVISAIDYLGRVRSADSIPALIELIDTEERRFLNNGVRALGRAASADKKTADEAADFLIDFYSNREPTADSRREFITAIGATGSAKGIELLSEIAVNEDERIPLRSAALEALSKIGAPECLDAVITCVNTNDPNVRSAAVGALGPFSGEAVERAILDAFRDSYYRTRIAAVQASRDRKLEAAVPYLKFRAERDEIPNVREDAIRALGAIASSESIGTLETLFYERRNSDRIRIVSAEMMMKNAPSRNVSRLIAEMDEAKRRNQTALYNGLLKALGECVIDGDKTDLTNITRRFMQSGTVTEKLYALDMIANNNLSGFDSDINTLASDRNEGIARRARQTQDRLGTGSPRAEQATENN